jgi:hypothetical protein
LIFKALTFHDEHAAALRARHGKELKGLFCLRIGAGKITPN